MEELLLENRIYLPPGDGTVNVKEHLKNYIQREFPDPPRPTLPECTNGASASKANTVYSVPRAFQKVGEAQACCAERIVFQRWHGLASVDAARHFGGLWLTFFHNASYAGHSFRNQRFGKLMIREHDFVIFAKYQERYFMVLAEVKSTNDSCNNMYKNIMVPSDAKIIKNNKRSAQHQLRDHVEILHGILKVPAESRPVMQCNIMWPFLGSYTKDPKQITMKRWKDESELHVFRDILQNQEFFNQWFHREVLSKKGISEKDFTTLLSRYLVLSCGVFMDEISAGIVALLTQSQLDLLTTDMCQRMGGPVVVHGAAGTGKTLLVLRKLEQLYHSGKLNAKHRALYACYWPGIKIEVEKKLKILGIADYVDTTRFYITHYGFLKNNNKAYKHIFVDEAEALSLVFEHDILRQSLQKMNKCYHKANCTRSGCTERLRDIHLHDCPDGDWGVLWILVDVNQASLFMPRYSMEMLQIPNVVLNTVMRCTGYIFQVFKQFYISPIPYIPKPVLVQFRIPNIEIGHNVQGPPIYWVSTCASGNHEETCSCPSVETCTCPLVRLIIDLCATKGFKPNDVCVIPFLLTDKYVPQNINRQIDAHFVDNGYRPRGVNDVEYFISNREVNDFLIAWALRLKGLEFKVVVLVIDTDDFDIDDIEDRRKAYIMASRCTCMLIIVSPKMYITQIDLQGITETYPFSSPFQQTTNAANQL